MYLQQHYYKLQYVSARVMYYQISLHIDVEAGLSLIKSTIAESGMEVTSRPYRTKQIEF